MARHPAPSISGVEKRDPLSTGFLKVRVESGTFENPDYNAEVFEGAIGQFNIEDGVRWSTSRAFLDPIRNRSNLSIATHAQASRIELNGRTACGVHYVQNGEKRYASARSEVLLCAGPIVSPKLLELSGIGRPEVLREHGIDVVHALPGVASN